MKKILHLHLFLITWIGFSQNASESYGIEHFSSILTGKAPNEIRVADNTFPDTVDFLWMQEQIQAAFNTESSLMQDNETFDTFVLQQQLETLNNITPFRVIHNASIERYIRVFLRSRKDIFPRLMDRARFYFPLFEAQLDKYDLPLELKYLAVVESALIPFSKSRTGAKGLWQFTYVTGKQYGLEINSLIDERYDPVKSTDAACRFLKRLYAIFGDWDLVLAAYNAGPGNVSKAIRRAGGNKNYWEIRKYLPSETRGYLPAFYATLYLFNYSGFHRIYPTQSTLSFFETDTVQIKRQISFKEIAGAIDMNIDLLKILNPQYKTGIIPSRPGKPYHLTILKPKMADYIRFEKENSAKKISKTNSRIIPITPENSYRVQKGDNLARIASKFNITLSQLKSWNGLETDYLIKGQRLVITDKKYYKNTRKQHLSLKHYEVTREISVMAKDPKPSIE